ncbi:YARHG domain-containing protein [uncultured Flavobacterium sp.]|uniref:YARHG domain-containing protein n=1 Tax=uncultured Flavobacterium sp. TaxID=165435 RepID=UPI0025EF6E72|nr:YARHG domain-containing protein [uncultured Flavobacterium sp.]
MKKICFAILLISLSVSAQIPKDCSKCSSEIIDETDIQSLDSYALKLLKNEIYARKGYVFSNLVYADYFKKFSWYKPLNDNSKIVFSDLETNNIGILNQKISEISQFISTEQNSKYKTLSTQKIKEIFTESRRKELGINFNIWKVYDYQDKTAKFYLVLTEDNAKQSTNENPMNNAIKAFNFKIDNGIWTKTFETNDTKNAGELSIWFWSRYIYVEDFDGDGIIEPMIFYGTNGYNGYGDGRAKILLYYKGKKIGIRIQNGILDDERNFSVDAEFYNLPKKVQDKIVEQMNFMVENDHSLLPYGWEKKMAKKMTFIKE